MSTTGNNTKHHWNWTKIGNIGMYVIEILVVIAIIKFFAQLLGGSGGAASGIADIFGNAANFVNGVFNGCSKQEDCSKGRKSDDDCKAIHNCSYREVTTGSDSNEKTVKTCVSSNGTPTGGGISTLGCFVGIGAILTGIVAVLSPVLLGSWRYFNPPTNELLKLHELLSPSANIDTEIKKTKVLVEQLLEATKALGEEHSKEFEKFAGQTTSEAVLVESIVWGEPSPVQLSQALNNREGNTASYIAEVPGVERKKAEEMLEQEDSELDIPEHMLLKLLSPGHSVPFEGAFKKFVKTHIIKQGLVLNATQQAVFNGNYKNGIEKVIDRVITTAFSAR